MYYNKLNDSEKYKKSYGETCCKICGQSFTKYELNEFLCSNKCKEIYTDILIRENIIHKIKKKIDKYKKTL